MRYPNRWNKAAEPIALKLLMIFRQLDAAQLETLRQCGAKLNRHNCLANTYDAKDALAAFAKEEIRNREAIAYCRKQAEALS